MLSLEGCKMEKRNVLQFLKNSQEDFCFKTKRGKYNLLNKAAYKLSLKGK